VAEVKYVVEYETKAGPGAIIDGTVLEDLKGWPTKHSFEFPAINDEGAVNWFMEWFGRWGNDPQNTHRYMWGRPRLLKITTFVLKS